MKGKFIVIEGIDGCGKGTQLKRLASYLFQTHKKNAILLTREPTQLTEAGIELRKRLAEDENPRENAEVYTELFIRDRKQHLTNVIIPALNQGINVLCDRYKYSTIIYQHAQGVNKQELIDKQKDFLKPDAIFILDVPVDIALERIKGKKEVFEKKEFLEELRTKYKSIKEELPKENIIVIDGSKNPQPIHKEIVKEVEKIMS